MDHFWAWVTEHWFLAFMLACMALAFGMTVGHKLCDVVIAFLQIFHRRKPAQISIIARNEANEDSPLSIEPSTEAATGVADEIVEALRSIRRPVRPIPPPNVDRRSAWDRMNDGDSE